jgi:hypothetical protein
LVAPGPDADVPPVVVVVLPDVRGVVTTSYPHAYLTFVPGIIELPTGTVVLDDPPPPLVDNPDVQTLRVPAEHTVNPLRYLRILGYLTAGVTRPRTT